MQALGGNVSLLDYSEESLCLMRSLMRDDEVKLILGDARNCPFEDSSFDIVFHQGLLEHFASPFPFLKENHRILKRSGILVVDVPQTFHLYTIMKHMLITLGLWFGGWERQFTIASLAKLLRRLGFEPIHVYGDWSRPGIFYKILRQLFAKFGVGLPMYPKYFGSVTEAFYNLQNRLRRKKILMYTVLSIGIIARKI